MIWLYTTIYILFFSAFMFFAVHVYGQVLLGISRFNGFLKIALSALFWLLISILSLMVILGVFYIIDDSFDYLKDNTLYFIYLIFGYLVIFFPSWGCFSKKYKRVLNSLGYKFK
ncbi:hypothetical protein [Salinivibrio sp. ML290]|uniref:hypothetical protein n=1 Tax=Salinivibrio sp. ML290 TaxID=1909468 RepID=UPI00098889B4|nr:hypothetical protein [Salinivibrio sp. ML290]OOE71257.1 hypothetical protein BZG23_16355 [Salinivibrio sp. ML290]